MVYIGQVEQRSVVKLHSRHCYSAEICDEICRQSIQHSQPHSRCHYAKKEKADILLLSKSQYTLLQKHLRASQNLISSGMALLMFTGVRIGELRTLRWDNIDLSKRIISVSMTIRRIIVQGGT